LSAVEGVRERLYRIENPARGPDESAAAIQARASLIGEFLKQRLQGRREEAAGRACASADLRNVEAEGAMSSATALPKVYLAAWFAYPLLVPFYLLGKTPAPGGMKLIGGVAQVGDYYLVAVMALVFATLPFRLIRPATPVVRAFGGFVCCTALVNLT